ncbi:MAG: haloacid dehalogenase type II [Actinomycetota bacterium]|nr:haloacid dehalogenase type II [Actinomycetota bacterium]
MTAPCTVGAVFFDLFGTLLSLAPLDEACDRLSPGRGAEIAARWRARQLEASWLRTAMEQWADFDVVTLDALRATLQELGVGGSADESVLREVADAFIDLPLVDGAGKVVQELRAAGLDTGILTNASSRALERVRGRIPPMDHYLSVDAAREFKPHPRVYQLAVDATGLAAQQIGFVTANGWDAAGAGTFGFRVAWLRPGPTASLPAVGAPEPIVATWPEIVTIFIP